MLHKYLFIIGYFYSILLMDQLSSLPIDYKEVTTFISGDDFHSPCLIGDEHDQKLERTENAT